MSTIRTAWRSASALGVITVGIPALATLLATPATACFGLGCGGMRFHAGPAPLMFARPQTVRSFAVPVNRSVARLSSRPHLASTATVSSVSVSRNARLKSLAAGSSAAKALANQEKLKDILSKPLDLRKTSIPGPIPVSAGGPSATSPVSNASTAPAVSSVGGGGVAGGLGQGGGSVNSVLGASHGNGSSGVAQTPSAGGGSGQFTTANGPSGGGGFSTGPASSVGATTVDGAPTAKRSSAGNSVATSGATSTSTTATKTSPTPTRTLMAVTACVTPAGSCPMERDVGTACQCKDLQGNVYDGIVK